MQFYSVSHSTRFGYSVGTGLVTSLVVLVTLITCVADLVVRILLILSCGLSLDCGSATRACIPIVLVVL